MKTKPGVRVGILGGGQLARMLALSAHNMGVVPCIFSDGENDPAQQVAPQFFRGSLKNEHDLKKFIEKVDIVTFESEFLDADVLKRIQKETGKPIYPSPEIIGKIQDRLTQKTLLDENKIPTAEWKAVNTPEACEEVAKELGLPLVFKKRRFGYDGYGTFVVKNGLELKEFVVKEIPNKDGFIAEKWIPFKRELACMFARSVSGEVVYYPLVESYQKDSRCFWVKGPVKNAKFEKWAQGFKKLLNKTDYVGAIGVELFDTKIGLIVNELAPRVHNSGHYTLDAFTTNQFDIHLKALLDQDLKLPAPLGKGFAMVNLLGAKTSVPIEWEQDSAVKLHWYGKKEARPGRKMGHLNCVDSTPEKALNKILKTLKRFSV